VAVVNLSTNTVTSTIEVGGLPEKMLLHQGKLYVCNSNENTISVINTTTNSVTQTYTVHDGPSDIVLDANGKAWVLCNGKTVYDSEWNLDLANSLPGALVKLELSSGTEEEVLEFATLESPSGLAINGAGNKLYYLYNNGVYSHEITATSLSATPLVNRSFYGLGIDPTNEYIYGGTYGFSSNQKMIRYTPQGNPVDSFTTGIGTNGFVFRRN
jgi:YVTN family beta-propeller protein